MYLINFSSSCFITRSGLNYPLSLTKENEGLTEYLMLIPFINFDYSDFRTDIGGKLFLNAGFRVTAQRDKISIVKSDELLPKILLLMSVPDIPEARFVSLDGDRAPEKVYSFLAGDRKISGVSQELLIILNVFETYRFALLRNKRSVLFYNISVTRDLELKLSWENYSR